MNWAGIPSPPPAAAVAAGGAVHCGGWARRSSWSCGPGIAAGSCPRCWPPWPATGPRPARVPAPDPSKSWLSSHIPSVCLSLPRGVAAGGNHGVRSRYTCTLLFHQVSRGERGSKWRQWGEKAFYLMTHLRVSELLSEWGAGECPCAASSPLSPVLPHMSSNNLQP